MNWKILKLLSLMLLLGMPTLVSCGESPKPEKRRDVLDADGDKYPSTKHGGRDCDDGNSQINPLTTEILGNKKDDNCNEQIDEFTLKKGHWRLTSPKSKDGKWVIGPWHFRIILDKNTGIQYVRCLYIGFSVKSAARPNTKIKPTQWLTGLNSGYIPIGKGKGKENTFQWVYEWNHKDSDGSIVKIESKGIFTSATTVKGTLTIQYKDSKEKLLTSSTFVGKAVPPVVSIDKGYCIRCLGDATCQSDAP